MRTKNLFVLMSLSMAFLIAIAGCNKTAEITEPDLRMAEEEAIAEALFAEVLNDADDAGNLAHLNFYQNLKSTAGQPSQPGAPPVSGERTITITPAEGQSEYPGFPKLITIQFNNYQVGQGRVKNGIIKIYVTGPLRLPNTTRIITFENYTIDGNLTEGKKTISNIDGINFTIKLEGGKITFEDGTFILRQMERNRKWIAGTNTPFFVWDDEFLISGFSSGVNRRGITFSHTIVEPLHKKMACLWLVAGTIEMQNGNNLVVINYGQGECDNIATVTVNGETKEITLPLRPKQQQKP